MATSRCTADLGDRREQRRRHRDAGRRAVLRDRALRDVDVDVELRVEVGIEAEQLRARADVAERRAGRLLHHVAELAGERQVALAAARARLRSRESRRRLRSRPGRSRGRSPPRRASAAERNFALPRSSRTFGAVDRERVVGAVASRTWRATLRQTEPISRSRLRTPASRV